MLDIEKKEIERILEQIDRGFNNLHRPKKNYRFFDFQENLKHLFACDNSMKIASYRIKMYLAVLHDLFKPVSHRWSILKEINSKNRTLTYDVMYSTAGEAGIKSYENVVQYQQGEFESMTDNAKIGEEGAIVSTSKFLTYLSATDLTDDEIIKIVSLEKNFPSLFAKHGYTEYDLTLTFERFVSWLNSSDKATNSDKRELKPYSNKQIAIACAFLGIHIDETNYEQILKRFNSENTSRKILEFRITHRNELAKISESKDIDKWRKINLLAAKDIISGEKDTKALNEINRVISAFDTNYKREYEE